MRIGRSSSAFLTGVMKSITSCVLQSLHRVVGTIEDYDINAALRATDELSFLTKNCLINVVQLSDRDE